MVTYTCHSFQRKTYFYRQQTALRAFAHLKKPSLGQREILFQPGTLIRPAEKYFFEPWRVVMSFFFGYLQTPFFIFYH